MIQSRNETAGVSPRLLLTAGPTHEPLDAVRFIGNRSSGRLGVALADEAAGRGWPVTLLLGPTAREPGHAGVRTVRYRSCADLEARLAEHFHHCDVLIMAAAVSDYRPVCGQADPFGKRRRSEERITIELEKTPDLLAGCGARRRADQLLVGFALEPREQLLESARAKLTRKKVDMIVANPLETMDATTIDAQLVGAAGQVLDRTPADMSKIAFAPWLLDRVSRAFAALSRDREARGTASA